VGKKGGGVRKKLRWVEEVVEVVMVKLGGK